MTERNDFPNGIPVGQFPDRDSAYLAVAWTFPSATAADSWRAWTHGRRLAWVLARIPVGEGAGGEWHEREASVVQRQLGLTKTRMSARTN